MILNDIGRPTTTTLKKINQHLESNYGFKITESIRDTDLVSIMETIQDEISELKMKGSDAKASPEISKRLLILEGIKILREYAGINIQSPDLENVISEYASEVIDHFRRGGKDHSDLERALDNQLEKYRASEYIFPDDYIKERIRNRALEQILSMTHADPVGTELTTVVGVAENYGFESPTEADFDVNTVPLDQAKYTALKREYQKLQMMPDAHKDKFLRAKLMRDIAALTQRGRREGFREEEEMTDEPLEENEGTTMNENNNFVKRLRTLLETEVSQAEVMMAAKGFAQELQEMVEKIGRLQNEDLQPVTDQMRETYGTESASAFQTQIYSAFQGVMDSLYTAKSQVDDAVSSMATTGQVGAQVDMDKSLGGDETGMGGEMPAGDEAGAELDLDNIGGEEDMGDEFGGADLEEPLGREMKEAARLKQKIAEMKKIVAKARKLKEARK